MIDVLETGDQRIELRVHGAMATLTVNRPDKLNALDFDMVLALERAAHLVDLQKSVRVVILTGAGEKSFCAGGDIEAWSQWSPDDFGMRWVRHGHRAFDTLARIRQPLIAVLNGHCLGGGFELAITADLRIAEEHVKIGLPETGIGIIPGWSGTQRAVRRFGSQIVRRMSLGGELFQAAEAERVGLVDKVVPKGAGMMAALELSEKMASRGPKATALSKLLINIAEGEEREAAVEALAGEIAAGSDDLIEGIAAFKQKRKPKF
jgi:enoyl-CoA hydratase